MKRILVPLVILGAVLAIVAASASAKSEKASATAQACVLLPDKTSSVRYELFDRPYLAAAFKKAGVSYNILNALGQATTQRSQADQCITNGAKVILVDPLDSGTGASIENAAAAKGVKTIDYDRLTLNGKASYYVSYDNVAVGKTMGNGLVAALKANGSYSKHPVIAELNGGITDNNATLFKQGYDSILKPLYAKGTFKKAKSGDQWTDWDARRPRRSSSRWTPPTQQHQRRDRGERQPRRWRRHGAEEPQPQADPGHRPGCDAAGRAVHPRRLAERHRLKDDQDRGGRRGEGRVQIIKGQKVTGVNAQPTTSPAWSRRST